MKKIIGIALIALAVGACLFSLAGRPHGLRGEYLARGRSGDFATPAPPTGIIRVNVAEMEDLLELPGVGETLAQAMIDEREKNGPYHFAEDLMAVRGIGPAKLAQILPFISLE